MKLVLSSLSLMALLLASMSATFDNSTVPNLDIQRYMGTWYEIARFDHGFEKGLQFATANYSMRPDGKVKVVNSGYKNGERKISEGKAKTTDTPGLLRVSFFGPFYSDYRVMMITPDYNYALVGSRSKKYLWVLSRTTDMPLSVLNSILDEAKVRGYNTNRLIMVRQEY